MLILIKSYCLKLFRLSKLNIFTFNILQNTLGGERVINCPTVEIFRNRIQHFQGQLPVFKMHCMTVRREIIILKNHFPASYTILFHTVD